MALRWGIVSAGKVSNDFVNAVRTLPPEDHQIVAVAARSKIDALNFARRHEILRSYEGYAELAKDNDIDVVYVSTINPQHLEACKLMLDHGKHVLCEKPLTMNSCDTQELIHYAKRKKLFLMEGLWSRCFPVYHKLRELLDQGTIGDVYQVNVNFGVPLGHVGRIVDKELGGSIIMNVGIYALQFSQFVYKGMNPISVISTGSVNQCDTDIHTAGILMYSGGRTSIVSCSARVELDNAAYVFGTMGTIKIPQFCCPTEIITPTGTLRFQLPKSNARFNYTNCTGFAYEAEEVRQCIKNGLCESPIVTHEDSLELAKLMDVFKKNSKYKCVGV